MTPQPHPLRCETCKNRKGHYDIPFCDFWDKTIPITKYGMDLIDHIGCASHSDAPLTHDDTGNCLIICRHCGKVTQVQCTEAAPSPDETISNLVSENARIGAELRKVTELLARLNGEHDAAIAAQARKEVLDALARKIQQTYVGKYDNESGDIPEVPVDELADIIRSLRTEGGEP